MNHRNLIFMLFVLFTFSLSGCDKDLPGLEFRTVTDEEALLDAREIRSQMTVTTAPGLDVSLWASEKLLGDPIAIHMDDQGQAWVTVTNRSYNSEFDIRALPEHWRPASQSWESIEDRREFLRTELAPENSDLNSFVWDHNLDGSHDWRDLTVMKEEVWRLQDLTGNGLANRAQLFIRDFHEEITDVAGAIVYHEEELFLGVGPDMWKIEDSNDDKMGDRKESISHGYNVHLGNYGHGMSGAVIGPDGRLYWSIGDMGFNIIDKEGVHWKYPHQGAILRAEADGSNFEVYAAGLRNTHEFVFDKYANLITVDNDGDYPGEFERLVYLVNGSDSGWRINWQYGKYTDAKNNTYNVWMDENYFRPHFKDQAAHLLPPLARYHDGPAGMAYNPGTALGEEWQDHFFIVSFRGSVTNSPIYAFTLEPEGASFELSSDREVMRGLLPVGLDFGPDGALYMTDWVEGWRKNEKGRIWKLDVTDHVQSVIREETGSLLAEHFGSRTAADLVELLKHADMRVRQRAQFELARRDDVESLTGSITQNDHQLARIHGIWGLAQIGRRDRDAIEPLIVFLNDPDPEIRAQSARWLGDVRYDPAAASVIPLLSDEHPRVRFFAAEALGRMEYVPALLPIVEMVEKNDDQEIYLRHAGAIALSRLGDPAALTELAAHPSRAVRIAAVVALNRMGDAGVGRFLQDEDEYIVTTAARAINDDQFIEDVMADLARMLEQDRFVNEPLIRRAINANLYGRSAADARRLSTFAADMAMPENLRVEALDVLKYWESPSLFDRVTGQYRGQMHNDPEDARRALEPLVNQLLSDESPSVKIAVAETVSRLNLTQAVPGIYSLLPGEDNPEVRIAALMALHELQFDRIEGAVRSALDDREPSVRMTALTLIPELDLPGDVKAELLITAFGYGSVIERQTVFETLGTLRNEASFGFLAEQLDLLIQDQLRPELQLDLVLAAEALNDVTLNEKLASYQQEKIAGNTLSEYAELLYGGDPERGARIFLSDDRAQCIRCHIVNGEGGDVGPELSDAGNRLTREHLLQSMINPSERITPGYGVVHLSLHDGTTVIGLLRAETESRIIVTGSDREWDLGKEEILNRVNISSMPSMIPILSRTELRDLIEYMTGLEEPGL